MERYKIIRTSTVPQSLNGLLKGQLKFLNTFFEIIALSGYNEKLEEVKQREGVQIIDVNMERRISPLKDLISLIKLIKIFKRERPLVVHSITPKAGLLTMLAGKVTGVPIRMHTFTGLIFPTRVGLMQKLLIKMDQLLCWAATNVYPEGNGVKNDLVTYNITKKPLKVLANGNVNGINLQYFDRNILDESELLNLRGSLGIDENHFVFVFVGRLVGDKGINELVEAFERISKTKLVKLLFVGPLEETLDPLKIKTIKTIENNVDIISVGFQKDVRPYFAISDALVFPSYREGFPNVVMQAGAMNLPSIVTDINGCNEIIIDGKNGIIIPVKDIEAISVSMIKLIEDKQYYSLLRKNSRKMILERYEQQVVWDALVEEYNYLIKEKNLDV
ncbi:glycosyltransferase family 4 protein [Myroides odoratimimus]|uniref:glycosyltransferase family 4 protein n=1 Tax=Myroides odoratimimus TaxID=76832 RepID=UPI00310159E1